MNKISKREKIMLAVLLVLIVGCVYYLFFLTPNLEKLAEIKSEIAAIDEDVITAQAKVAHLNKMKKDVKEIRESDADIKTVPAYDNSKKLMNSLNLMLSPAVEYSVNFTGAEATDGIVRRTVELTYECNSYKDARNILQSIHDGPYPCVLQDVSISNGSLYGVNATLTYFEYVE